MPGHLRGFWLRMLRRGCHGPFPRFPRLLIVFLAVLILIPLAPQLAQAQSQSSPPTHKPPPPPPPPPATDQQQFASYWTTEVGWRTELQLRNNQDRQILTVTPVLRTSDGTETLLSPVIILPQEVPPSRPRVLQLVTPLYPGAPWASGASPTLFARVHISIIPWGLRSLCFHTLTHSFASRNPSTLLPSIISAPFSKNTGGGGPPFEQMSLRRSRSNQRGSRRNYAASLCSASKCAGTLRKSQTSPHHESIFNV